MFKTALSQLSLHNKSELAVLASDIFKAFSPEAPILAKQGGFIKPGWRPDFRRNLKKLRDDSRRIVAGLQADYAKVAGVPTLEN